MAEPTIRRRRLGAELQRHREECGMKLDDVERATGIDTSKLSRIEKARFGVKVADVETLLTVYGVPGPKRDLLLTFARDGAKKGWWTPYRDLISPAYMDLLSLESDAESLDGYEASLVPGLLQTAAYARATIGAINGTSTDEQINALVNVRMARQSVLSREHPLNLWVIIHESALHLRVADDLVMKEQMQKLLDYQDLPHVSIQVLPSDASPHAGLAGPFSIIGFPESADLDVVLLESLTATLYVEDAAEVGVYRDAMERLRASALPLDASADRIRATKDDLR